jgi:putative flippase GtrA
MGLNATRFVRQAWMTIRQNRRLTFFRYAIVGVAVSTGYTVNVILFVEFLGWGNPEFASALSFLIWTPISYLGHRDFTFLFAGDPVSSAIKFAVAFVARLAVSSYTVHVATLFGMHYLVGVLANWIVLPAISYFVLDLWVFRKSDRHSGALSDSARLPG